MVEELRDTAALAISAAWNEIGDVPFPLYQAEAERLGEAAVRAVLTCLLGSVEEMDALALRCQHESGHPGDTFRGIINAILSEGTDNG